MTDDKERQQLETELRAVDLRRAIVENLIVGLPPDHCSGEWCAREELEDELRVLWLRRKALTNKLAGSNTPSRPARLGHRGSWSDRASRARPETL